ncbi:MAG: CoB--CoM heterodisulfide reductase iron-sulfur subunit B family protein [Candidatus Bathyarchaeota archaeon]|nr:CoB--CoM heterodisulfide reductase iron-sulfur subunit B family protein [Candidatus Bathyarchaeota archaeon]
MKTAVFWGCRILTSQYAYEMSVREVMPKLGVELADLPEALCCGDPVKSVNDFAATYLSARVMALAHALDAGQLLVPCNRCHFTISEAKRSIEGDKKVSEKVSGMLAEEKLEYNPNMRLWHVIDFLHGFVGLEKVKKAVKPWKGLRLASHVGCQIIRYSDLGRVDNAENPTKLDELIGAVGAETVDYAEKLDCCGAHLLLSHVDTAFSLAGAKLRSLRELGVDGLVVSCPDCGLMYDFKQKDAAATVGVKLEIPVVYYTQLLGLALGIDQEKLGLHLNQSPVDRLLMKISV